MSKAKLNITVRVRKIANSENLKAFADICLNNAFVVKSLKVIKGKKGLFVSMPQTKSKDSKYYDSVYPLNKKAYAQVQEEVLSAYTNA